MGNLLCLFSARHFHGDLANLEKKISPVKYAFKTCNRKEGSMRSKLASGRKSFPVSVYRHYGMSVIQVSGIHDRILCGPKDLYVENCANRAPECVCSIDLSGHRRIVREMLNELQILPFGEAGEEGIGCCENWRKSVKIVALERLCNCITIPRSRASTGAHWPLDLSLSSLPAV